MAEVLAVTLTIPQARELAAAAEVGLAVLRDRDDPRYNPDRARALQGAADRLSFVRDAHDRAGRQPATAGRTADGQQD